MARGTVGCHTHTTIRRVAQTFAIKRDHLQLDEVTRLYRCETVILLPVDLHPMLTCQHNMFGYHKAPD